MPRYCTRKGTANVASAQNRFESDDKQKNQLVALADRLAESQDPAEREKLKEELARITFGE
jgi:hypothetical protein